MEATQYSIVLVAQDPASGNEPSESIQCVVISPAEMNRSLRTVILAPVRPDTGDYPTRVKTKTGEAKLNNIRNLIIGGSDIGVMFDESI